MIDKKLIFRNNLVELEPTDLNNVDLLIHWTLDPIANGPYKKITDLNKIELRKCLKPKPMEFPFLFDVLVLVSID